MTDSNDSRRPYFEHAFEILATEGYGGFKQATLCRCVGVTTGAFYHKFKNWRGFTDQFLDHWHQERTTRLAEIARAAPDPLERLELLVAAAAGLPHRAEAAIRVWGAVDPAVARIQESVDRERLAVTREAFTELLNDEAEADRFARFGLYLLIGFEQSGVGRDPDSLEWSLRLIKKAAAERRGQLRAGS